MNKSKIKSKTKNKNPTRDAKRKSAKSLLRRGEQYTKKR